MTSVSVSVENFAPLLSSSRRNSAKFSIMPLCTTASFSVACGCALFSVGRPCVAQRVVPDTDRAGQRFDLELLLKILQFAPARRRVSLPASNVATPAES